MYVPQNAASRSYSPGVLTNARSVTAKDYPKSGKTPFRTIKRKSQKHAQAKSIRIEDAVDAANLLPQLERALTEARRVKRYWQREMKRASNPATLNSVRAATRTTAALERSIRKLEPRESR